jgi:chitin disaccharide deacetylase
VRRLIVNADDFGLTAGVNRAIAELHAAGAVTSATLMAGAQAAENAIDIARSTPSLGVGCHVVLTGGLPVLNPREVPSLIDPASGRFYAAPSSFVTRLLAGQIRSEEIEAEIAAQIGRVQSAGVTLTHIDTHKHTQVLPAVLRPLLRAARACGIRAIRNPFEPVWSRRTANHAPWARRAQVCAIGLLAARFHRIAREAGFVTTDGALGLAATGILDEPFLASLLRTIPNGTWELVSHPGYNDADLGKESTRLKESRENERCALLGAIPGAKVELVSFAALDNT